jgi:hypothetical protein
VEGSGIARQDHRVPKCCDKEVCLGTGENTVLAVLIQSVDALMQGLHFTEEQVHGS